MLLQAPLKAFEKISATVDQRKKDQNSAKKFLVTVLKSLKFVHMFDAAYLEKAKTSKSLSEVYFKNELFKKEKNAFSLEINKLLRNTSSNKQDVSVAICYHDFV